MGGGHWVTQRVGQLVQASLCLQFDGSGSEIGCPAKLVSFRYNQNRNQKKFLDDPKQKDLFRFFLNIPKLESFGSFSCFCIAGNRSWL
jgi:hypothetical protein